MHRTKGVPGLCRCLLQTSQTAFFLYPTRIQDLRPAFGMRCWWNPRRNSGFFLMAGDVTSTLPFTLLGNLGASDLRCSNILLRNLPI